MYIPFRLSELVLIVKFVCKSMVGIHDGVFYRVWTYPAGQLRLVQLPGVGLGDAADAGALRVAYRCYARRTGCAQYYWYVARVT